MSNYVYFAGLALSLSGLAFLMPGTPGDWHRIAAFAVIYAGGMCVGTQLGKDAP